MTGPSWYEILGVRTDATPGQIKAAWRAATDKFEPGSGSSQFRLFNEAADVLLDPERRAAYDAELGADAAGRPGPSPTSVPTTVQLPPTHEHTRRKKWPRAPRPQHDTQRDPGPGAGRWTRLAVLVLLPLLTLASLAVAGLYGYKAHRDGQVEQARDEAPAAADRALEQVLAYDYRHLGADERRAAGYLTARYKQKNHFARTYRLLRVGPNGQPGPAVSTKTVVTAHVLGTAVVDAAPDLARVLVFVNQTSTKTGKDPVIFQNRVVATMVHSGNAWLVDDLQSY
jgi:Mce-associated membrane protein